MTFKLGSDFNLGKDLSKSEGRSQLVKHKDIRVYLQLYIPKDHILLLRQTSYSLWRKHKKVMPTIWDTNWDNIQYSQSLSHNKVTPTPIVYELVKT